MIADADDSVAPITYRIDPRRRIVYFRVRGDVTFARMCAVQDAYLSDPAYQSDMPLYVDCRVLTSIPTRDELRTFVIDRRSRGIDRPTGRAAMVVMTRLGMDYAALCGAFSDTTQGTFAVFTSHAEAHAWLGVTVPETLD